MADDMSYEALSVNGGEICKSPNLDKRAATGIRFPNGLANPICTPSPMDHTFADTEHVT